MEDGVYSSLMNKLGPMIRPLHLHNLILSVYIIGWEYIKKTNKKQLSRQNIVILSIK